ncbi:MAG: ABC transporter ATP-binding protein, partial [Beijerinckiaceae bacterium]
MSAVVIDKVGRVFPGHRGGADVVALQPTSLAVSDNDFITILGPSGCGKSTMLRIVAGLDRATSGQVRLDGVTVRGPGPDRGMVFQSYTLFPWLTIIENVAFGLREKGVPEKERLAQAREWCARVGLTGFENHYPKQLS